MCLGRPAATAPPHDGEHRNNEPAPVHHYNAFEHVSIEGGVRPPAEMGLVVALVPPQENSITMVTREQSFRD